MAIAIATDTIRSTETRIFNGDGCSLEWLADKLYATVHPGEEQLKSVFIRGTVGHAMIENFLKGGSSDESLEMLWEFADDPVFDHDWIETSKCTKDGIVAEIESLWYQFLVQYQEHYAEWDARYVEYPLEFETPNGVRVRTEPDVIFVNDEGRPVLVDWKLGTSKSGKAMQLYTYWYGLKQLGIVGPDDYFRAHFHYVTYSNPIGQVHKYPGDSIVIEYIETAEQRRRSGPYLPNPSYVSCRYCAWQDVCPLYSAAPEEDWQYFKEVEVRFG